MALDKPYEDVPGTTVFDADRARQGYHLNQFCMSLMKPDAITGHWEFTYGEDRVAQIVEGPSCKGALGFLKQTAQIRTQPCFPHT